MSRVSQADFDAWVRRVSAESMRMLPQIFAAETGAALQPSGGGFVCRCPFHDDSRPSMSVSSRGFKCHATGCEAERGGGSVKLLSMTRNIPYIEVLRELSILTSTPIPDGLEDDGVVRSLRPRVFAPLPKVDPSDVLVKADAEIPPSTLIPVPRCFPRPVPGVDFAIWRDEGSFGDRPGIRSLRNITAVHEYRDVDGRLLVSVLRMDHYDHKEFRRLCCGRAPDRVPPAYRAGGWTWRLIVGERHAGERLPVYGAHRLRSWLALKPANRAGIVIVEGEKCVDRMVAALNDPRVLVLAPMGGANCLNADWRPLMRLLAASGMENLRTIVWPDADAPVTRKATGRVVDPQDLFARRCIAGMERDLAAEARLPGRPVPAIIPYRIVPPEGVAPGWDVADAVDEGWQKHDIVQILRTRCVDLRAEPEPSPAPDATAAETEDPEGEQAYIRG